MVIKFTQIQISREIIQFLGPEDHQEERNRVIHSFVQQQINNHHGHLIRDLNSFVRKNYQVCFRSDRVHYAHHAEELYVGEEHDCLQCQRNHLKLVATIGEIHRIIFGFNQKCPVLNEGYPSLIPIGGDLARFPRRVERNVIHSGWDQSDEKNRTGKFLGLNKCAIEKELKERNEKYSAQLKRLEQLARLLFLGNPPERAPLQLEMSILATSCTLLLHDIDFRKSKRKEAVDLLENEIRNQFPCRTQAMVETVRNLNSFRNETITGPSILIAGYSHFHRKSPDPRHDLTPFYDELRKPGHKALVIIPNHHS